MAELHELMQSFLDPDLVADGPGKRNPFKLGCAVGPAASEDEIAATWPETESLPAELHALWLRGGVDREARGAKYWKS